MIVFEFMPPDNTHQSFAYQAICRAITQNGTKAILWDKNQKNIYDVYDEMKPDKIIFYSDFVEAKINKIGIDSWSFKNWYVTTPLISDNIIYRKVAPDDNLKCKLICISPYKDVDMFDTEFYKSMHNNVRDFRYFGVKEFGGHKDCGPLPENTHSLFLSSAERVMCLSKHFAVNAFLCNKNINYNLTEEEVASVSASNIIKNIV